MVAIKEASGNISQIADIARIMPDDFTIYSGNDDQVLPIMALGGKGSISTIANIAPRQTHELTQALLDGDFSKAKELQLAQIPLIHAIFCEVNPIPVKTGVSLLGKIEPNFRLPLSAAKDETVEGLKRKWLLMDWRLLNDRYYLKWCQWPHGPGSTDNDRASIQYASRCRN